MTDDDPLARFERRARRARDDAPPPIDVTEAVLARVRAASAPRLLDPRERTTRVCLAASLAVALTAAWAGADAWASLTDPLDAFVAAMTTEAP